MKPKDKNIRTFEFLAAKIDDNKIKGAAAVIGNRDSYRTVIFPGFFSDEVLTDAVSRGFMADNHDWDKRIGTIESLRVVGRELQSVGEFHSDDESQRIRTQCCERQDRGKSVGQSIGFGIAEQRDFRNGAAMLDFAKSAGHDLSLFDEVGIRADQGKLTGLLRCSRLYEFSPVSVPANDEAVASDVRGALDVEVRGVYLGDDVEQALTMKALSQLGDRLFYRCFYSAIYGDYTYDYNVDDWVKSRPKVDESLAIIAGGCDELKAYALKYAAVMLAPDDAAIESAEDAMLSLRAIYGDADKKIFEDGARAARSYESELDTALAAVKSCTERTWAIQAVRAANGRTLSADRIGKLKELRTGIDGLLASIPPPPVSAEAQAMTIRASALRLIAIATAE